MKKRDWRLIKTKIKIMKQALRLRRHSKLRKRKRTKAHRVVTLGY
jgi:hypothetical protein